MIFRDIAGAALCAIILTGMTALLMIVGSYNLDHFDAGLISRVIVIGALFIQVTTQHKPRSTNKLSPDV